jgi:hypothetical protein
MKLFQNIEERIQIPRLVRLAADRGLLAVELEAAGHTHGLPLFSALAWLHFGSGRTRFGADGPIILAPITP